MSGQGLVYNFESEGLKSAYEKEAKLAEKKTKKADEEEEYKKEEEEEDKEESMDIFLSLINGVVNANKHMKWDNGAVQVCWPGTTPSALVTVLAIQNICCLCA